MKETHPALEQRFLPSASIIRDAYLALSIYLPQSMVSVDHYRLACMDVGKKENKGKVDRK